MEETTSEKMKVLECRYIERNCRVIAETAQDMCEVAEGISKHLGELLKTAQCECKKGPMERFFEKSIFAECTEAGLQNMSAEIFARKVLIGLYKLLPLDNVLAEHEMLPKGLILRRGDTVQFRGNVGESINVILDQRVNIYVGDLQIGDIALRVSHEILRRHLYKWKAFVAQEYSKDNGDVVEIIYGVLEDKT